MVEEVMERIADAEMILIGVGEGMAPKLPQTVYGEPARPYEMSGFYSGMGSDEEIVRAYRALRKQIGARPYFAVTLNTDGLIYKGGFERDLVVAPCGSMERMQCGEHIVDAAPVRETVLTHLGRLPEERRCDGEAVRALVEKYAVCPVCGRPLRFHVKSEEGYMEEGYRPQWQSYNRWLSCTLNRRLCVVELGVGFQYPQVIRWPFEKVVYFNQKSVLIRIHEHLPQTAAELGKRGIPVECSPLEFCLKFPSE